MVQIGRVRDGEEFGGSNLGDRIRVSRSDHAGQRMPFGQ